MLCHSEAWSHLHMNRWNSQSCLHTSDHSYLSSSSIHQYLQDQSQPMLWWHNNGQWIRLFTQSQNGLQWTLQPALTGTSLLVSMLMHTNPHKLLHHFEAHSHLYNHKWNCHWGWHKSDHSYSVFHQNIHQYLCEHKIIIIMHYSRYTVIIFM